MPNKSAQYTITAGPTGTPVTLSTVKEHLRVTSTTEDGIIQMYIDTAVEEIERRTNRLMRTFTFQGNYAVLDRQPTERFRYVELEKAPLNAVTAVEVTNDGSTYTAVAAENFNVEEMDIGFWRVQFPSAANIFANVDYEQVPYPLRITFTAGYGSGNVPPGLTMGILHYVAWLYDQRGDCPDSAMPASLRQVIGSWKIKRIFA